MTRPDPVGPQAPHATRQPHAVLDIPSRQWKAIKIERLLRLDEQPGRLKMLEVGTGSGGIANYFGTHPSGRFEVDAVDVVDNRLVSAGFRYQTIAATALPFGGAAFDVVISNHVIEHVGEQEAQLAHLAELHRVLRADGIGYLAVPNRWMLVEPHYRLAFLSWLPVSWRTPYLRLSGRGSDYDCRPFAPAELESMLRDSGFEFAQQHGHALLLTYEIENPNALAHRIFRRVPDAAFHMLRSLFPTLIYRIRKSGSPGVH